VPARPAIHLIYAGDKLVPHALDVLLLDSKLSVPQPRPGSVSRAGLTEATRAGVPRDRRHCACGLRQVGLYRLFELEGARHGLSLRD
jgi:hypothetical protein